VLAIVSLLGVGAIGAALPLAVLCPALAHVLPGIPVRMRR